MKTLEDVYSFWFRDSKDLKKWFFDGEQYDAQIKMDFQTLHDHEVADCSRDDAVTVKQTLCKIILLDQFSRHIYRGTPNAFAADHIALEYALRLLRHGQVETLQPFEQLFALMPLQHSESIEHKDMLLAFIHQKLQACENGSESMSMYKSFLLHTRGHRYVLTRFGRYPSRNEILQRQSTPTEVLYLTEGTHGHL